MKTSLKGHQLPETEAEFQQLRHYHRAKFTNCIICNQPHDKCGTEGTRAWRETQITGICGPCWDKLLDDAEEARWAEGPL